MCIRDRYLRFEFDDGYEKKFNEFRICCKHSKFERVEFECELRHIPTRDLGRWNLAANQRSLAAAGELVYVQQSNAELFIDLVHVKGNSFVVVRTYCNDIGR